MKAFLLLSGLTLAYCQGYSTECTDLYYSEGWLVGTCPTDDGGTISSSVYLPTKIENSEGTLEWKTDGAYWDTCDDCTLVDSGSTLQCYCDATSSKNDKTSTLDLEEYIANYDGHLLSNLTGAITSIPANSSYGIPATFDVELLLSSESNECSEYGATISLNDPTDCYYLNLGVEYTWACGSSVDNDGWEIIGYTTEDCTGDAIVTFTPDNEDTCYTFTEGVIGFSVTPLWNAD
ncbi:hypothetical protein ASPZODRAFT_164138 [Penicilliopsis zonata CBS 506.65]|uniref:Cyanovirin-N domain-containing protein n=1 Tax=Penicilliopsis zonata CBS 506.65 TaxID=1073090 RepID=A0A1L9SSP0_9EURO|nr:hypothetical protein ASPZODRAFT_164138 [Penicilliopsis zonata CBS 506.65]OJJ50136.1 hypothetical protein ASPZODRAFT_164138 [Penicilliopsis zonata CBS 506.65]